MSDRSRASRPGAATLRALALLAGLLVAGRWLIGAGLAFGFSECAFAGALVLMFVLIFCASLVVDVQTPLPG